MGKHRYKVTGSNEAAGGRPGDTVTIDVDDDGVARLGDGTTVNLAALIGGGHLAPASNAAAAGLTVPTSDADDGGEG